MRQNYKMLAVIYLASISAPITFYKVPPVMANLIESFNISVGTSGWLMTIFAIIGMIFALPAGQLVQKFGVRKSIIISLTSLLAGSTIGYFTDSLTVLLASRMLEGVGLCLLSIAGSTAIFAWFPDKGRGIAMGVWATWVPFGTFLIYLAPFEKWQSMWLTSIIYTAIVLVLFILVFKLPEGYVAPTKANTNSKLAYKNVNIWVLTVGFMMFNMMSISVKSYLPLFLRNVHDVSQASIFTNIMMFASLFGGPITGFFLGRINSYTILTIGSFVYAGLLAVLFSLDVMLIGVTLIGTGILLGLVPASTFYSVPRVMKDEKLAGLGMSILSFGQNTGMVLGPIAFSYTIDSLGWLAGGYIVAIFMIITAITGIILKKRTAN